ncbi:MAG: ATP synthase subunit I [Oscillospiraceae bacterium]|nr:ATP synthase subunit I [Oscillospiraceae bacterium]
MKLSPAVKENLRKIAVYNLGLTVLENIVFLLIKQWDITVLNGSLLGYAVSVITFLWIGISVQKAMEKEQKQAQMYMQSTYMVRVAFFAIAFVFAINSPVCSWVAMFFTVFFTRISIMIINFKNKEE